MVMGFATLIESRDQSTGGHIRRTTKYTERYGTYKFSFVLSEV